LPESDDWLFVSDKKHNKEKINEVNNFKLASEDSKLISGGVSL